MFTRGHAYFHAYTQDTAERILSVVRTKSGDYVVKTSTFNRHTGTHYETKRWRIRKRDLRCWNFWREQNG